MQLPLEITYRNVQKTPNIERLVREKIAALEKVCGYIISCRIAIERDQQHQESGNPYRVRIDIRVPPQHEIIVTRETSQGNMHDPLDVVIRDAFNAAKRQLVKLTDKQRGEVKRHPEQDTVALVDSIFYDKGFGFLKTMNGYEVYFHRNSVVNSDFDQLRPGMGVNFIPEMGEKGPQASSVRVVEH